MVNEKIISFKLELTIVERLLTGKKPPDDTSVIAKLKEYIESKDDLDAEIPSDDEEDKKKKDTAPELKGLSKKELDLMKSIK